MPILTLKDGRLALHSAVSDLLAGNGVEADDIKRFRTARFSENPTHVVVSTLFMDATPLTITDIDPAFHYFIQVLSRYQDEASEEAAEDNLDDLQYLLITGLGKAESTDVWQDLTIVDTPPRTARKLGSHNYKIFEIRLKMETS